MSHLACLLFSSLILAQGAPLVHQSSHSQLPVSTSPSYNAAPPHPSETHTNPIIDSTHGPPASPAQTGYKKFIPHKGQPIPLQYAAAFGAVTKGLVGIPIGVGMVEYKEHKEKKEGKPIDRKKDIRDGVLIGLAGIPIGAGAAAGVSAARNKYLTGDVLGKGPLKKQGKMQISNESGAHDRLLGGEPQEVQHLVPGSQKGKQEEG